MSLGGPLPQPCLATVWCVAVNVQGGFHSFPLIHRACSFECSFIILLERRYSKERRGIHEHTKHPTTRNNHYVNEVDQGSYHDDNDKNFTRQSITPLPPYKKTPLIRARLRRPTFFCRVFCFGTTRTVLRRTTSSCSRPHPHQTGESPGDTLEDVHRAAAAAADVGVGPGAAAGRPRAKDSARACRGLLCPLRCWSR